jgi:hypothetical protein
LTAELPGGPGELDETLQQAGDRLEQALDSGQETPAELDETPAEAATELAPDQRGMDPALDRVAAGRHNAGLARREYDWPAIRRRYVEGVRDGDEGVTQWPSLDAVAEHFGVAANRVREKSAQEGWRTQRTQWQAQLEATRRQAKAAAMSKEATNLDGRALDASKLGLQLAVTRLTEIGQAAQRARSEAGPGGGSGGVIDAQEMQRLAQAVDLWHKIGLRAVGDPETHRLEITGANGAPIEIAAELRRDDPSRMAGVLGVLQQAGLGDLFGGATVLEGEVVEDGAEP